VAQTAARAAITDSRSNDIRKRFDDATWHVAGDVLHRGKRSTYSDDECRKLVTGFSAFFDDKLSRIRQSISTFTGRIPSQCARTRVGHKLSTFATVTAGEVHKVLLTSSQKSSPLDVLPAALLRASVDVFAPVLARMANLSFDQNCFPKLFKAAHVLPLLKKPGLDKEQMSNYRPISNLSTVSKVLERQYSTG